MPNPGCRYFEDCEATLCPMDGERLPKIGWYPYEEICRVKKFARLGWIKKQKSISRKYGSLDGFFNLEMLEAIGRVRKGIEGANPDDWDSPKKWIKDLLKTRVEEPKKEGLHHICKKV